MALRYRDATALAARGAGVAAHHVGGCGGLVDEDQTLGIEVGLAFEPGQSRRLHVRPVLLGGVKRPFLRVIPWRAKNRDRPLVLVCTPRSPSRSRNSRKKICGCSLTGFQDQGGLRLDAMRGVISARRLGRNAAVPPDLGVPADRRRHADAEALGGFTTGGTGLDRRDHAVAQVE